VYVVLIDGMNASAVSEQLTPTLWGLTHGHGDRATSYAAAHAVLPSVTNTNHAALLTASYPAANGIIGNRMSDRVADHAPFPSELARYLKVETLFTVAERERPALKTAALFGKSRLVGLFVAVPDAQERPDVLWGDLQTETEGIDATVGFASDHRTMDETIRTIALQDPDMLFVALPDVDRTEHLFGPDSAAARRAIVRVDDEIRRLIGTAKAQGTWGDTVLFVTADHGMESVAADRAAARPYPLVLFGRELLRNGFDDLIPLSRGGIESVFLPGAAPAALDAQSGERLARVRRLALDQPEVAEAWYRLPNPADFGNDATLAHAHPDWHLDDPQAGELVLVARPHCHFGDPFDPSTAGLLGNHGGAETQDIPLIIAGGDPRVRAQIIAGDARTPPVTNPDIGATVLWLLDLRPTRTLSGAPVPDALAGHVLREAFSE
jgi:predicted AlkP superfamily pyrophosphatase or phosphodiesterase